MRQYLRLAIAMAVLAGLAGGAALRATRNYAAGNSGADKVWSTKKVMDKVHVGKQALLSVVNKDLRKAEPDWKSDEENLTEIIRLMSMLTKQKPPRGSQTNDLRSWPANLAQTSFFIPPSEYRLRLVEELVQAHESCVIKSGRICSSGDERVRTAPFSKEVQRCGDCW